ncbi:MAG: hypothetical protein HKO93_07830 [Flavobacteriales bacterium]|nr:hypothetical protein [Flavobacteriales bacterium]
MLWYLYSFVIEIDRKDADIFKYYDDGLVMNSAWEESPETFFMLFSDVQDDDLETYYQSMYNWDRSYSLIRLNDNRTMIRLHALIGFVSGGSILTHVILFNLLSFIGLLFLFRGFKEFIDPPPWTFLLVCIIPPSLLFWSSGMLKECLVLLPLGISFYAIASVLNGRDKWRLLILGTTLFIFIKPYVLLSFVPLVLYVLVRRYLSWSPIMTLLIIASGSIVLLALSTQVAQLDIIGVLSLKQKDFINVAVTSGAGSTVDIPEIKGFLSFIINAPEAVFRTYLRPGIWEMRSSMDGLAAIENSVYILLILSALFFRKSALNIDLLFVCLIFLMSMGIIIGSVTPVLGAIVRYKVPAIPFLMIALLHIIDLKKVNIFKR